MAERYVAMTTYNFSSKAVFPDTLYKVLRTRAAIHSPGTEAAEHPEEELSVEPGWWQLLKTILKKWGFTLGVL